MLKKQLLIVLIAFTIPFFTFSQNTPYELKVYSSHHRIVIGDEVKFDFYMVNHSSTNVSVPTSGSSARGIDDVLTHNFKVLNSQEKLLNKQFKCGVGTTDKRIMSGVLVKVGDSVLLTSKLFKPNEVGTFKIDYIFDFNPNNGKVPNSNPELYKTILLTKIFEIHVENLDTDVIITPNRISSEELRTKPVYKNVNEALKDPSNVFRLNLQKPSKEEVEIVSKLINLQDLTINEYTMDSFPTDLFKLNYRFLNLSVSMPGSLIIPNSIQNSTDLEELRLRAVNGIDLSGFEGGTFNKLKEITLQGIYVPIMLKFSFEKMPVLQNLRMVQLKQVTFMPDNYSACTKLSYFEINSDDINYPKDLILPTIKDLILFGKNTNIIPDMSKCVQLESLSLYNMKIIEIPASVLTIPNLKKLTIRKEANNNDTIKELKKRGVEIIKI